MIRLPTLDKEYNNECNESDQGEGRHGKFPQPPSPDRRLLKLSANLSS